MNLALLPLATLGLVMLTSGCDAKDPEGVYIGDCRDGADNDNDRLYDCDDPGCDGAEECQETDETWDTGDDSA